MWNLEYELALILISAAIIGWIMGRFVCKSNEHKERSNNKALANENQRLEKLLTDKDTEIHKAGSKILAKNDQIIELEHRNNTTKTMLDTLRHEHDSTLSQLQTLKPFQAKFKQLSEDYDKQSQQIVQFKSDLQKHQEELNSSHALSNKQQAQLSEYKKKIAELEQIKIDLQNDIEKLNNQLSDSHGEYGSQKDKYAELMEQYNG